MANSVQFEYTQRYIQEVMADRLQQAGFVSRKGEGINWYRIVNEEVIQTVYFRTSKKYVPVWLEIGYGAHPFFIPPLVHKGPHLGEHLGYEQCYNGIPKLTPVSEGPTIQASVLWKESNSIYRQPDVMVLCPADEYKGRDILEQVLQMLEPLQSARSCYDAHKRWREEEIENGALLTMSPYFVDEVIYWDDRALLPYCRTYISSMIKVLERAEKTGKFYFKSHAEHLRQLRILKDYVEPYRREEYLHILKEREEKVLALLKKNTGLTVQR